jgi:NMD protein affecting ribosome stability and mRNA decay
MRCEELRLLLNIYEGEDDMISDFIAAHIRSCQTCNKGIERLSKVLITNDELTCEQCRSRFPAYYEATRPDYPQVEMSNIELAEVALHLGQCASCKEQYEMLVFLSEIEEHDEMVDL